MGHVFNMSDNRLYVTKTRVNTLGKASLTRIVTGPNAVPAKQLSGVVGQVISMSNALGPKVYLHTRHMYYALETRRSWNSVVHLTSRVLEELSFWTNNVSQLNGTELFDSVVYSDASGRGYGGYTILAGNKLVRHGLWEGTERNKSSTWREAKAIDNMIQSLANTLQGHNIQWYTDNKNVVSLIHRGSMNPELQAVAEQIVDVCSANSISVNPVWVPREQNQLADYVSRLNGVDDWGISTPIYKWLNNMWGPFTIDRFATWYNTKCSRFNSRFWNPGCENVDAFAQNWGAENNWVVPSPSQIIRAWRHFYICKARGVMLVPLWKGADFWPCLCSDGTHLSKHITDWVGIPDYQATVTVPGRCFISLLKRTKLSFRLIAVFIDFSRPTVGKNDRGFCMSFNGICEKCTFTD